jgi:hypothetical protein
LETFRKYLDLLFKIVLLIVVTVAGVMFALGAFPININPSGQRAKFDIAYYGWEPIKGVDGQLEITHEEGERMVGVGALKYKYITNQKVFPGFKSEAYPIEGLTFFDFWMKSERPSTWRVQIKRKETGQVFYKTFNVGTEWKQYNILYNDIMYESNPGRKYGNIKSVDFDQWLTFLDISHKKYPNNTIWIDDLLISR